MKVMCNIITTTGVYYPCGQQYVTVMYYIA